MPLTWKIEYHAIGKDGEAFAWHDNLAAAKSEKGCIRVERHIYYVNDVETVWELQDGD